MVHIYIYIYTYIHQYIYTYTYISYPYAPCGVHTVATRFYSLRFVAADDVSELQNALDSFEVSLRSYKFSEVLCQFHAGILH